MRTTIYRVIKGNEVLYVAPNKTAVKEWMETPSAWNSSTSGAVIEVLEVDIPTVAGVLSPSQDGDEHVVWKCPACDGIHDTDISDADKSPCLWSCERKGLEYLFFVTF